jgi:glutathione synthase/RimK-type ligase-like ATP-grasp enzyme
MRRVCLLAPSADYPNPWVEEHDSLCALLRSAGVSVSSMTWDRAESGALANFDLAVPLMAWPYVTRPERWFVLIDDWQFAGVPMLNSPALLRWNSDKAYLLALSSSGVAAVPTIMTAKLDTSTLAMARDRFGCESLVIKPPVSAGAIGTSRLLIGEDVPAFALGQAMLVQPLMPAIASEGEYSLFFFDGWLSHAIVKRPADGDFRVQAQFGGREAAIEPPPGAQALADAALAAACRLSGTAPPPLYARVDMVRGDDGALVIMELELIEPSLFLQFASDGGAGLAAAVMRRLNAS